jgi:hypothetical protein
MILALIGIMILLTDFFISIIDDTGEIAMSFHIFTVIDVILINLAFMLYS